MSEGRYIAAAEIPEEQRFTYTITPQPGRMLHARTVGNTLRLLDQIFSGIWPDLKSKVCIVSIKTLDDGGVSFDLAVLPVLTGENVD